MSAFPLRVPKLPRAFYWAIGAAIAFVGAIAARLIADRLPEDYRLVVWLMGGGAIFLGLAVLSMGTRSRLKSDERPDLH